MSACGLDFGTSNTTFGTAVDHAPVLIALDHDVIDPHSLGRDAGGKPVSTFPHPAREGAQTTIPSAIFYEQGGAVRIGRSAIATYVDGVPGRLMRSLKSVLGTTLIDETTLVGRERVGFRDVIAYYLGAVKRRAEQASGQEFRSVVHGRPVHFVDGAPEADRKAEETLREILRAIGFDHVTFQFEPIAAALDYERQISREEIALIADIGGGTSDFSVLRLSPERHRKVDRTHDILANDGVRIGGTDFDRRLSLGTVMPHFGYGSAMQRGLEAPSGYFHDLATWSTINRMYEPRVAAAIRRVRYEAAEPELFDRLLRVLEEQRGHTLAMDIEQAKISLSEKTRAAFSLEWVEPGLKLAIRRADLVSHTKELATRIGKRIKACLDQAELTADAIDAVFLTGGSVQLAHVRRAIVQNVPAAQVIDGDTFGAVGKGLTIEAARRYGSSA